MDVMQREIPYQRVWLEKAHLTVSKAIDPTWHGLRDGMKVSAHLDTYSWNLALQLRAYILGLPGEKVRVEWPSTWWEHAKKALYRWLLSKHCKPGMDRGPAVQTRRERLWWHVHCFVTRRLGPVRYAHREVQQFLSVCPHLTAQTHRDQCVYELARIQSTYLAPENDEELLP